MKFVDQRTDPIVRFNSLSKGEMFLCDGQPFMKIDPIETALRIFNAIDLVYGEPYTFGEEETIEKIWECELVVKG